MASTQPASPITIPPELCRFVLESLSSQDLVTLRLVSRSFYNYFTSEEVCHFAHRLYFPLSSESGKTIRTRKDFDAVYSRSLRWKQGRPTHIEVVDEVASATTSLPNGFLVGSDQGLLAYQRSRGVVVLKDLSCPPGDAAPDTTIDLQKELGECIMERSENIQLRDGESIRMQMNRGVLMVLGEAHIHPVPQEGCAPQSAGAPSLFSWWSWIWGGSSTPLPPRRFYQHPHTLCAIFSTKPKDRGKVLHTWFERDSFIIGTALNEFYAINEFDLVEQRLEGYVFPKAPKTNKRFSFASSVSSEGSHDGHHFTIRKKALYPQQSSFTIAPDTRGKVFYLSFLPPSTDRRPVVEIHSVPQFNPMDSTWSECTVVKRVILRSLGRFLGGMNGLTRSSFWVNFDKGTTVRNLKSSKIGPTGKFAWDPDEDVVRLRMKGDLFIPGAMEEGETVNMIAWNITARPSPNLPSTISDWRQGKEWASEPDHGAYGSSANPCADSEGDVDLEDVYPSPTYYTQPRDHLKFRDGLESLPDGVDLDCLEGANESGNHPSYLWVKHDKKNREAYAIYSARVPGTLFADSHAPDTEGRGFITLKPSKDQLVYPAVPGRDDKEFVPAGVIMKPKYKVVLGTGQTVAVKTQPVDPLPKERKGGFLGRAWDGHCYLSAEGSTGPGSRNFAEIPMPGFDDAPRDRVPTRMDRQDRKYWVYGKEPEIRRKGEILEERAGEKIVIVRFD